MRLKELFEGLKVEIINDNDNFSVSNLCYDSRKILAGDVFFAWKGEVTDGHSFIVDALSKGVGALVVECREFIPDDCQIPYVVTDHGRKALSHAAAMIHGHPAKKLGMVGITGTNGKTSTSIALRHILESKQQQAGLIGTVMTSDGLSTWQAERTTPEALDLQILLNKMVEAGSKWCVMEVSSHALAQGRVHGVPYRLAMFTHLTQDHLDYHGTMEAYFDAKALLFDQVVHDGVSVIGCDDLYGCELIKRMEARKTCRVVSFGKAESAMHRITNLHTHERGSTFDWVYRNVACSVSIPWIGMFNAINALGAAVAAFELGMTRESIVTALEVLPAVPGRMQIVNENSDITVIVDYAHTPDAVDKVLTTLRDMSKQKLIVVVGCGGNRDRSKRPLMAKCAVEKADLAIFTSDNPRDEEPAIILQAMLDGVQKFAQKVKTIIDRKEAINQAIQEALPGNIVLIAGKGHEDYQEIKGKKYHFNDVEVAREALQRRAA